MKKIHFRFVPSGDMHKELYSQTSNIHYLIRDVVFLNLEHKNNLLINDVDNQIIGLMERLRIKGELK